MKTPSNPESKVEREQREVQTAIEKVQDDPGDSDRQTEEDQEAEETECGFCLFMKGGDCKDAFIVWERCVEEAEKNKEDIVEKCLEATSQLKKCMDAHVDYYEPILRVEKAREEEAAAQELDKEATSSSPSATPLAQDSCPESSSDVSPPKEEKFPVLSQLHKIEKNWFTEFWRFD